MAGFDDLALVLRELERLAAAGRPMPPALRAAAADLRRAPLREALGAVATACEQGTPLGEAFAAHGAQFPDPIPALVDAGVAGGDLPGMLGVAAEHCESEARLRRSMRDALAYPVITLAICILVALSAGWIVAAVADPGAVGAAYGPPEYTFRDLFYVQGTMAAERDLGIQGFARGAYAATLAHPGRTALILLGLGLAAWVAVRYAVRSARMRGWLGRLVWRLPWIGPVYRTGVSARFLGSLGRLLGAGVPQAKAVTLCEALFPLAPVAAAVTELRERTAEGATVQEAFGRSALVPASVVWLLSGHSGDTDLPAALLEAAEQQRERHTRLAKTARMVWLPFVQIVTGILVFLLMSLLLTPLATAYLSAGNPLG